VTETEQKATTGNGQGAEPIAPEETNGAVPAGEEAATLEGVDVARLVAERDEFLDQLQRSRADFANFRRRTDGERAALRQLANRELLLQIVPVLDDLGRALASVPPDQAETGWVRGTQMIAKKLADALARFGVTEIEAVGQPFDPALHEAVATDPGSTGEMVVEVYQTGYRLGDGLLRPAMVKTGSKPVA
jgi:molecular chaperone GrpE